MGRGLVEEAEGDAAEEGCAEPVVVVEGAEAAFARGGFAVIFSLGAA